MKKYFLVLKNRESEEKEFRFLPSSVKADYEAQKLANEAVEDPSCHCLLVRAEFYVGNLKGQDAEAAIEEAWSRKGKSIFSFKKIGFHPAEGSFFYREYRLAYRCFPTFGLLLSNEWDFNTLPFSAGKDGLFPISDEWDAEGSKGKIPCEKEMANRLVQVDIK